jgi:hypothetical protein
MANLETQGASEGDHHFFYFEIDGDIHVIKTKSLEDAQRLLVESGIEAPILEQVQQEDGAFLSHGCDGQLNLGLLPAPIPGSAEMLAAHQKLNGEVGSIYPSYKVIMIGKLSVGNSYGSQNNQVGISQNHPVLFRNAMPSSGSDLEPIPDLISDQYTVRRVA